MISLLSLFSSSGGESSKNDEDVDPTSKKAITCPVCFDDYEMVRDCLKVYKLISSI